MKNAQKVLIASHRGCFGGNIVENTLAAFESAVRCGADIVETDIHKTRDGVMILYHDPSPMRLQNLPGKVENYTLKELQSVQLMNVIGQPSGTYINTLEDLLKALKGRCMINLDQCWHFIDEAYNAVVSNGMAEQALIKGRVPYDDIITWISSRDFEPQFIPIITCDNELAMFEALPKQLRIPTVEVFLKKDDDQLISPAFIDRLGERNIRLWVNALSLGGGMDMSAHHDDDVSMTRSADEGWGWLVQHGAGIIQTDWTSELRHYLDSINA